MLNTYHSNSGCSNRCPDIAAPGFIPIRSYLFGLVVALFLLAGCSSNEIHHVEASKFKQYLAKKAPSKALPSHADLVLLKRFRPRIFLAKGQVPFIDFYSDYIANGSLFINGKRSSDRVTPNLLNKHKNDTRAEFRYAHAQRRTSPTVYARVDRDKLIYQERAIPLTFLSYNLVFAHSGLLKGLARWQKIALGFIGHNKDWHQLDHNVRLTIVLLRGKPIAVMMQQHNYQTTWLIGSDLTDTTMPLPVDQRVAVDVALQSNELYPHSDSVRQHRSVPWINQKNIEFIKTGRNKPMMAGWDITHGEIEQHYTLKFLPTADAFYMFRGRLGQRRKLIGRDGLRGTNFSTLPELIPLATRLVIGYRPRSLQREKGKLKALFKVNAFSVKPKSMRVEALEAYKCDFIKDLGLEETKSLKC